MSTHRPPRSYYLAAVVAVAVPVASVAGFVAGALSGVAAVAVAAVVLGAFAALTVSVLAQSAAQPDGDILVTLSERRRTPRWAPTSSAAAVAADAADALEQAA